MTIALIVQRYGTEILGGSEYHCRLVAERLSARHDVEVLTTCARDYVTWANEYPEGTDRVRGVTVRRFTNARTRDIESFNAYSDWIFSHSHTAHDEEEWLKQQGPWCPALIEHLEQRHASYDALVFFTYLYAPTVLGLRVDPGRSVLVPTAHDEPAIRLDLYRDVFRLPRAVAFNTGVERAFLRSRFDFEPGAEEIAGCGVDLPPFLTGPGDDGDTQAAGDGDTQAAGDGDTQAARDGDTQAARDGDTQAAGDGDTQAARDGDTQAAGDGDTQAAGDGDSLRAPLSAGAAFRRRHRLLTPFALFGGRIDRGKGCEELIEYFGAYAAAHGDAMLALMGVKLMPIPPEPYIRFAGMLPEAERLEALEAATVVVVPSPYESLSLLALEAFACGTPVLANARSDVLTDHCQRSNAGLYYADQEEFVECLKLLVDNAEVRRTMGRNGRAYVRTHYSWDVVLGKYERLIAAVAGRATTRGPRSRGRRTPSRGRGGSRARRQPGSR